MSRLLCICAVAIVSYGGLEEVITRPLPFLVC
jgi:hypothetical protein